MQTCPQETRLQLIETLNNQNYNEWASEMFFAMATSTLKVSRSYYPKIKIEIEHQSQSEDGRFLVFQILVNVHR